MLSEVICKRPLAFFFTTFPFICIRKVKHKTIMLNEADKNISEEEKLNKFIDQKSSENEALKKLLDELKKEIDSNTKKDSNKKKA